MRLVAAEGALPPDLRGVLYRNGPGRSEVFGTPYQHPFDGDGLVTRFAFDGAGVSYRSRFVRTREYQAEARAGRMLYRSFGTNLPGGLRRNFLRLRFKNAANTSVVMHGGKLLALWEGGLPHWLDADTLDTLGRYDFDGSLRNRTSWLSRLLSPELPFSAHPKLDPDTGELFNFGTLMGSSNRLAAYRVRADGTMAEPSFTALRALSFVHDFVLTRSYRVYFLSAVSFGLAATLFGLSTPVASLSSSEDAPATILVVPRDGTPPIRVPVRGGFLFHFVNGYEDPDGQLILDGMRLDAVPSASLVQAFLRGEDVAVPPTRPTRWVVNLAQRRVVSETELGPWLAELPTVDPRHAGRAYRHFWSTASIASNASNASRPTVESSYQRILHFDHAGAACSRDFAPDFPGEPLFVPASDAAAEGEGWLLTLVYRALSHRTDLYVLRADDLRTVARLELPQHLPPGFHGTWAPG